jgi:unsaturated rhamnogalacturonyl hydrolase
MAATATRPRSPRLKARFDAILADPPKADLTFIDGTEDQPCQARWCWSDALFMGPAAWTGLTQATGDPRYAAYGDKEFWAATDWLLDKQEGLYYRDSRYFDRRDDKGRKIFWSRGNGWVYAGIVDILKTLPADHPSRPRYEALFRRMSDRLMTAAEARRLLAPFPAGAREHARPRPAAPASSSMAWPMA